MKYFLVNCTSVESHYGCTRVDQNITSLFAKIGWAEIGRSFVGTKSETVNTLISLSGRVDVIVINGEGTLHDKNPFSTELIEVATQQKALGRKVVLINASIYLKNIKEICLNTHIIFSRNKSTVVDLEKYNSNVCYVPDISFYNSEVSCTGNKSIKLLYTDSVDFRLAYRLLNESIRTKSYYIPFIFPPKNKAFSWTRYFKRILKSPRVEYYQLPFLFIHSLRGSSLVDEIGDIDTIISSAEQIVTGRFHAACFAIRLGVPFDYIESNTPKISQLVDDVGLADLYSLENGIYRLKNKELFIKRTSEFISDAECLFDEMKRMLG